MQKLFLHIISLLTILLSACHPIDNFENNNRDSFNALWTIIDEHYCFFEEKNIDWNDIYDKYAPLVNESMSKTQLFYVCSSMINELKDGHTNLSSGFETSYYRQWWSEYPQNFNLRIIEENYLNFNYKQLGAVIYKMLPQNIGYIYIPSFSSALGAGNIDWILSDFRTANALIIDLRDNGGGMMSAAEEWVRHFITEEKTIGYFIHKNGPSHNDFDSPYPIKISPLTDGYQIWIKPVIIITNRSTFSAANHLVMCMKELPQVHHIGATTGGGAGMPYSQELPNGWGLRMSAVKVQNSKGEITEFGIKPDPNCEVNMSPIDEAQGIDSILEFAIDLLQ